MQTASTAQDSISVNANCSHSFCSSAKDAAAHNGTQEDADALLQTKTGFVLVRFACCTKSMEACMCNVRYEPKGWPAHV
eukprot:scaffold196176_cov19-Tisochrysis_lutea.AAC.3